MTTVTYQVETLSTCQTEINNLLYAHWQEVGLGHDVVPLDPDWPAYQLLENMGMLHILTCRIDGVVRGYHVTRVDVSPHYKSTLHGFVDIYYLSPEYRGGRVGIQLFIEAEKSLKARGVKKLLSGTKQHESNITGKSLDMSKLFERLGWKFIERTYAKVL